MKISSAAFILIALSLLHSSAVETSRYEIPSIWNSRALSQIRTFFHISSPMERSRDDYINVYCFFFCLVFFKLANNWQRVYNYRAKKINSWKAAAEWRESQQEMANEAESSIIIPGLSRADMWNWLIVLRQIMWPLTTQTGNLHTRAAATRDAQNPPFHRLTINLKQDSSCMKH